MRELAASVKEQGVLQPILVRPATDSPDKYEIVAGERRWRAAQLAGLAQIPAIVKPLEDDVTLEVALIENIQRQDLNPLEEAASYRRLLDEHGYTQASLATRLGKSRVYVANTLRLLALPGSIRDLLSEGRITAGHGKAMAKNPQLIYQPVQTDKPKDSKPKGKPATPPQPASTEELLLQDIADKLCMHLQTKVKLQKMPKGGRITLEYYSNDELSRLLEMLLPGTTF